MDDMLIAACGSTHPFAGMEKIHPDELGEAKWLLNRVGSVARDRFEEVASQHGWPHAARCQIIMHIPDLTRDMLLTGRYLAILPRSVALPWLSSGEVREMDTEINVPLALLGFLWNRKAAGAATSALATFLRA